MFGAVDIGGTKTLVAVFDNAGKLINKVRFETPPDYKDFKSELKSALDELQTTNFNIAAVAVPGELDKNRSIGLAFGNLSWKNVPIRNDAEQIFKCPVILENDAKVAGLSEALLLKKYRKVLYVTISTGINGGLVVDGKISPDFENTELGEMLFEHNGKLETWETITSGKSIVKEFGKPAKDITDPKAWDTISHNIAIGLIDLIASLTPDIIVIGGGVGSHFDKFGERLNKILSSYSTRLLTIPPVIGAKRPEEAVIYGCFDLGKSTYDRLN